MLRALNATRCLRKTGDIRAICLDPARTGLVWNHIDRSDYDWTARATVAPRPIPQGAHSDSPSSVSEPHRAMWSGSGPKRMRRGLLSSCLLFLHEALVVESEIIAMLPRVHCRLYREGRRSDSAGTSGPSAAGGSATPACREAKARKGRRARRLHGGKWVCACSHLATPRQRLARSQGYNASLAKNQSIRIFDLHL